MGQQAANFGGRPMQIRSHEAVIHIVSQNPEPSCAVTHVPKQRHGIDPRVSDRRALIAVSAPDMRYCAALQIDKTRLG